jgi:hypothetical protein
MNRVFQRTLRYGLFLLALAFPSLSCATASGQYGPLAIVVLDDRVHRVFAEGRVGNGSQDSPQFSCLFLLEGRLDRNLARVTTWFPGEPERIGGTLLLGKDAGLQLEENHGGCLMTSGDMKAAPYTLSLDEPREDWIGAGLVTAKRAVLRGKLDERSRQT